MSLIFHTLLGTIKMKCNKDAWKPNKRLIPVKGTYFFLLAGKNCQDSHFNVSINELLFVYFCSDGFYFYEIHTLL